MENKRNLNGFNKTANVVSIILKVIFIISTIGLVTGIVGLVTVNLIPKSMIQDVISSGNVTNTITLGGLSFVIENTNLIASEIIKMFSVLLAGVISMTVFIMLCTKKLLKIMDLVKIGTPFTMECVNVIRGLGILVIAYGVIVPILSGLVEYITAKVYNLEGLLLANPNITNVSFNIVGIDGTAILLGVIIIILAGVFNYGCYLQDEYDSTL